MPITIPTSIKQNQHLRWQLPDEIFFAAGACHILAYALIKHYQPSIQAIWIKPESGDGNHIVATDQNRVFDYRGYTPFATFFENNTADWQTVYPNWDFTLVPLPTETLISELKSRAHPGLWLREPSQFWGNALPRAEKYLTTFNHT